MWNLCLVPHNTHLHEIFEYTYSNNYVKFFLWLVDWLERHNDRHGWGRQRKRSICWFTTKMAPTARTGPGQSQEPATPVPPPAGVGGWGPQLDLLCYSARRQHTGSLHLLLIVSFQVDMQIPWGQRSSFVNISQRPRTVSDTMLAPSKYLLSLMKCKSLNLFYSFIYSVDTG